MENTINILGTLHSSATGNTIAVANEILDESKNKKQNQINTEVSEELNLHTTRLNALTSQNYVTVEATNQTTAVTDILPATGAVDTIYRVGKWNGEQYTLTVYSEYTWDENQYKLLDIKEYGIDNEPILGSNNLIKSGGVQNELALGAVYDVSAKNPTAGPNNDGKFESFSALLSDANLNTLIPTAYRKGGMSIKFVQTSDNKYVQYRLMATSFSTTESNWQGVDDEPAAGSENFVKSGGLHNRFNSIEEELGLPVTKTVTENIETPIWQTGYICARDIETYITGKRYSSNKNNCTPLIDISKHNYSQLRYKRMIITTPDNEILAGMCFYTDANIDTVIEGAGEIYLSGSENGWEYSTIDVPEGAKYARFSCRNEYVDTFECEGIYVEEVYSKGILQDISKLKNDANSLQATTQGLEDKVGKGSKSIIEENVLATWVADGYICYRSIQEYVEGKTYNFNKSKYSSFIDISKYSSIKYVRMITTTDETNILAGLCFYSDANEESVISGSGQGYIHGDAEKSFYEDIVKIPASAKYVRFSCHKEFINDFYCKGIYNDYVYSSGLGKKVEKISEDVEAIQSDLYPEEIRIAPVLCRRRFYLAMTEWCKNHNLSDSVIIEGAGGGGTGDEVENPQLGHGLAQYKMGDAAKILFNAYSYDFIANALSEKEHIAYPEGATEGITLSSSSFGEYSENMGDYKRMVFKSGSGNKYAGLLDENYFNFCSICYHEDFDDRLVLGVVRSAGSRTKRYKMFKALMDIAKKKINNDDSISNEEATLISNGQGTDINGETVEGNAIAIKVPIGNPKAFHDLDFNDANNPYLIYAYRMNYPIITMSMIKLLTAIITLDYMKDLDVFLTVTKEDRDSAGSNSSAYNVLPEGCRITIRDLIYAALLPSSNVACYVLARYVGQFLLETYGDKGFIPNN